MKSVSFAVEETYSSACTLPVHSTGSVSTSLVKVRTSACFSKARASFAPGKARPGISLGCSGSARNVGRRLLLGRRLRWSSLPPSCR